MRNLHIIAGLALLLLAQAAPAAGIDGKWEFTFDTEGGIRTNTMTIQSSGEKVTATMGESKLEGTFKDGKLELSGEFYSDEAGYKAMFKLSGVVDGETMKGEASWDVYDLPFTAKRLE